MLLRVDSFKLRPSLLTFCFSLGDLLHHQLSFLLLQFSYYTHRIIHILLYRQQLLPEVLPTCDDLMVDSLHLHEEASCLLNVTNSPRLCYFMLLTVHQKWFKQQSYTRRIFYRRMYKSL